MDKGCLLLASPAWGGEMSSGRDWSASNAGRGAVRGSGATLNYSRFSRRREAFSAGEVGVTAEAFRSLPHCGSVAATLDYRVLSVLPEHAPHDVAGLAQGAVGVHSVQQVRHDVLLAAAGRLQGLQAAGRFPVVALATEAAQLLHLPLFALRGHLQDGGLQ